MITKKKNKLIYLPLLYIIIKCLNIILKIILYWKINFFINLVVFEVFSKN